ncbi:MFS transporter [Rhizohabitans arisaemae]|uniref:MFS transporter n=1 Tax=Rhizohabitans arisaemae TaxID=2720610 RepID=UPI0024B1C8DB|nr:MFS transporter [Rhizohabitans arisaemae]
MSINEITVQEPPTLNPRRWAGLAVLSVSLLLVVMDMTILNVALPEIATKLRPDSVQLLWIVDAYALVVAGLLVTASAMGDRLGRKRVLLSGFVLFGIASLAVLLVRDPAQLIAARVLLGVGGAMIMPSTLSLIRALFTDPKERATALGVWSAMAAVGVALGPIVGGLLLEYFSWQAAFLVNVPVMVIGVAAGIWLLPESRNPLPGRWDALGTVLSIIGMTALIFGIKRLGKYGVTEPVALACLAVAVAALVWFVRRSLHSPNPLLELRLFKKPVFSAGVIAALVSSVAMAAILLLIAQWMQLVEGYSALESGLRLLPTAIGAAVLSPLAPKIAEVVGPRTVLAGGLAVTSLGFLTVYFAPATYPWIAVALALIGAGAASLAIASAVIMSSATPAQSGSAAAIEETSYELGAALGVAVLGSIAAALYRDQVSVEGLTGPAAQAVQESLAGALEVAAGVGSAGAALAAQAQAAFTSSLEATGLAGGILTLVAAVAVWALTPRDLDLAEIHH